jgi:amino acid permease
MCVKCVTSSLYYFSHKLAVGAGIVAIPLAIQQCGLFLGVFLLIFLAYAVCQITTVLMECGLKAGKLNLEELSGHFFGSHGMMVLNAM